MDRFGTENGFAACRGLDSEIVSCLAEGGVVVTGNARTARLLRRAYGELQQSRNKSVWRTPEIFEWETWLSWLWERQQWSMPELPIALSPLQELAVWKRVIRSGSVERRSPIVVESLAKLASRAYALLSEYEQHGVRSRKWENSDVSDREIFRAWAAAFDAECGRNGWVSRSELPAMLSDLVKQELLSPPRRLVFTGFDHLSPAKKSLVDACAVAGASTLVLARESQIPLDLRLAAADDGSDELELCAAWIHQFLSGNPGAKVAVIAPDIAARRGEIERVFRRRLAPESLNLQAPEAVPFEFSLGKPLAETSVIKAALLLLRWLIGPLDQPSITWLTLSGFLLPDQASTTAAARVDANLRRRGEMPSEATIGWALRHLSELTSFAPGVKRAYRLASALPIEEKSQTAGEWCDFTRRVLGVSGWPGGRSLSSVDFQAIRRWERLLDSVAMLSFDNSRVGCAEFFTQLEQSTKETLFAPESQDAPVQVMGVFESAGQRFDALWLLGADEQHWPALAHPNPLLPLWLQREAGMPQAETEEGWALASRLSTRIAGSAPVVVFSYAKRNNESELRLSPLIPELFGDLKVVTGDELRNATVYSEPELQVLEDAGLIAWSMDEAAGGADILQRQSACPFKAFAVRRLGAHPLEDPERALGPRERGTIVHAVLEQLWSDSPGDIERLHTRDDLRRAIDTGRLPAILTTHIDAAFRKFIRRREMTTWGEAYFHIEKRRLQDLLTTWLLEEAQRESFEVEAREKKLEGVVIGNLKLNLRVDRVDVTPDNERILIDYKTGPVSPARWHGSRPDEPQLPVYGAFGGVENLSGVLFAKLRAGESGFHGHLRDARVSLSSSLKGSSNLLKEPYTDAMLDGWIEAILSLADEFVSGAAAVAPKRYPKTCKHCALPGLCRVTELNLAREENHKDAGAADLWSADE